MWGLVYYLHCIGEESKAWRLDKGHTAKAVTDQRLESWFSVLCLLDCIASHTISYTACISGSPNKKKVVGDQIACKDQNEYRSFLVPHAGFISKIDLSVTMFHQWQKKKKKKFSDDDDSNINPSISSFYLFLEDVASCPSPALNCLLSSTNKRH